MTVHNNMKETRRLAYIYNYRIVLTFVYDYTVDACCKYLSINWKRSSNKVIMTGYIVVHFTGKGAIVSTGSPISAPWTHHYYKHVG